MTRNRIGSCGLEVSRLGLGCVTFGREIDERQSFEILDYAFERGITLFDTAESYGGGQAREYRRSLGIDDIREAGGEMHSSEKIIGRWLQSTGVRKQVVLQTKISANFTGGHLEEALAASLERLRTDYADIYLFHSYDSDTPLVEALAAMTDAVRSGRVRVAGCSNFSFEQLSHALQCAGEFDLAPMEVIQPVYNLVRREIEAQVLPFCRQHSIAPIVYSPLGGGFLTGKYRQGGPLPSAARFAIMPGYADEYFSPANFDAVQKLDEFSERWGIPVVRLALAWIMHNPDVKGILIGARTVAHVENGIQALDQQLSPQQLACLNDLNASTIKY